jgi:hypothetical protein
MKIPLHIAEKLLQLAQGKILPASSAKHTVIEEMIAETVILRTGRIKKTLTIQKPNTLQLYLQNKYSVNNLEEYISTLKKESISRADLVEVSGNSKIKHVRTFKGFLVNCYEPIPAILNGVSITLNPFSGTFQYIYDFENFEIPEDITIIGIENPENFRYIEKQKYLFDNIKPLFVSRYPQNQSKDLLKWLQTKPNNYLHFGDFDFEGIKIYLSEYKKYLGEKANFFVPENIDKLIEKYGNKNLYDTQKIRFDLGNITEQKLLELVELIHKYKRGLEQEVMMIKV